MNNYLLAIKSFWINIIPADEKTLKLWLINLVVVAISVGLIVTIGPYSVGLLFLAPLIYYLFQHRIFPLCLILAVMPFVMYWAWGMYVAVSILSGLFIIFVWLIRIALAPDEMLIYSRQLLIITISFFILALLSALANGMTSADLKDFVRFIIFFPAIYAIYALIRPKDTILIVIAMTIPLIFAGLSVVSEYMKASGPLALIELYRLKPGGILPTAFILAYLLALVIPYWVALGLLHSRTIIKIISFFIGFILCVFLMLTNDRSSMFGLFLALAVVFRFARKLRYFIGVVVLLAIVIFSIPNVRNVVLIGLRFERGTTGRGLIWGNAFDMISRNPFLGIGPGNFADEYDKYFRTGWERNFVAPITNAHNFALDLVARLGILGLLLAAAIYYFPLSEGIRAARKTIEPEDGAMVYGTMGALVTIYGNTVFEASGIFSDGRIYVNIIFWILYCILLKVNYTYDGPSTNIFFNGKKSREGAIIL